MEQSAVVAPAGLWDAPGRKLTTGLLLTVTGTALEALAVATTMPATVRDLGGIALYGWAFSSFMLANLVGIAVSGGEADRLGPARPFALGVASFAAGLVIAGLAPSMPVVVAGRLVQGFGAGIVASASYVAIGRAYHETAKARMLALLATAWVVPGLVGPALAGVVADAVGWRWVFLGLAPLPAIGAALALPALRRFDQRRSGPPDRGRSVAAARLAVGAGCLIGGASLQQPLLGVVVAAVGLCVGLPAFARLMAVEPGDSGGLPAIVATAALLNLAFFGVDAFVPLALTSGWAVPARVAGLPLTTATLGWTAGAWLQTRWAPRSSRRLLVLAGLLAIAIGIVAIAALLLLRLPPAVASAAWLMAGLGMGLAFTTVSLTVLEAAKPGREGVASAALQLANALGTALGAGCGGVVLGRASTAGWSVVHGLAFESLLMLGVTAAAALAASRMPDHPTGCHGRDLPV